MRERIIKEVRGLLPALSIAVLLAFVMPFRDLPFSGSPLGESGLGAFAEVIPFLLVVAVSVAASVAFTSEFHFKTLQMLLSQPISRLRIWTEKLAVCFAVLIPVLLTHAALIHLTPWRPSFENWMVTESHLALWILILLATICSASFWGLVARTLPGAAALNLGSQVLTFLILDTAFKVVHGKGIFFTSPENVVKTSSSLLFSAAVCLYAAFFLWLSWRRFQNLQVREATLEAAEDESVSQSQSATPAAARADRKAMSQLIRKELRLQRPTLLLAGVFTGLWILTLALHFLSRSPDSPETFLSVLTCFYVPLAIVLAGCISIADESRIGILEWHLTFPVSRRRQWSLKVAVGACSAILLGVVVPTLLALASSAGIRNGFKRFLTDPTDASPLAIMVFSLFMIGFWAACLLRDVVRATLGAVITVAASLLISLVAIWSSQSASIQAPIATWTTAVLQLTSWEASRLAPIISMIVWIGALGTVLVWQSLRSLQRNLSGPRSFGGKLAILLVVVALLAYWSSDLVLSFRYSGVSVWHEVHHAAERFVLQSKISIGERRAVSVEELAAAYNLSRASRHWLRNTSIMLEPNSKETHVLSITFPSGSIDRMVVEHRPIKAGDLR